MIELGTIEQIWRYPVKSMAGESISSTQIIPTGLALDRVWAIRDEMAGEIRGAKHFPRLMLLRAVVLNQQITIIFPDGSEIVSCAEEAEELVSDFIEHPVTLWPLQDSSNVEFYRKNKATSQADIENIFDLRAGDSQPDFSVFPADKLTQLGKFSCPPGSYTDAYPIHIVSTADLAALQQLLPQSQICSERFRANLVINNEISCTRLKSSNWLGSKIQIGETLLRCEIPTLRCAMTGHAQLDLVEQREITRTIASQYQRFFGIYCRVEKTGTINAGAKAYLMTT